MQKTNTPSFFSPTSDKTKIIESLIEEKLKNKPENYQTSILCLLLNLATQPEVEDEMWTRLDEMLSKAKLISFLDVALAAITNLSVRSATKEDIKLVKVLFDSLNLNQKPMSPSQDDLGQVMMLGIVFKKILEESFIEIEQLALNSSVPFPSTNFDIKSEQKI